MSTPQHAIAAPAISIERDGVIGDTAMGLNEERDFHKRKRPACHTCEQRKRSRLMTGVIPSSLTLPRSAYIGWTPSDPLCEEADALKRYKDSPLVDHSATYTTITLENFCIYNTTDTNIRPGEMVPLHHLAVEKGLDQLYFDGTLVFGDTKLSVKGVGFRTSSIEGYGDEELGTVQGGIYIQSILAEKQHVWYRLERPDDAYMRYFEPFLWIADLGKHFVEYLLQKDKVTLADFRRNFFLQLRKHMVWDMIKPWYDQYSSIDYRASIIANVGYLWKEACGVDQRLSSHPVWEEIDPMRLKAIPTQSSRTIATIVTPFVMKTFRHMYFAAQLQEMRAEPVSRKAHHTRRSGLRLTPSQCLATTRPRIAHDPLAATTVKIGDVVCLKPDNSSGWNSSSAVQWFAYVQDIQLDRGGSRMMDLIWLYESHDTSLNHGRYPMQNELFFSDNCSCSDAPCFTDEIIAIVDVEFSCKDPSLAAARNAFCIRKKYRCDPSAGLYDFVDLQGSDFQCQCGVESSTLADTRAKYAIGSTVLVRQAVKSSSVNVDDVQELVPAQIISFEAHGPSPVFLRRLHRCLKDLGDTSAPMNEFICSIEIFSVGVDKVIRPCKVAVFASRASVAWPYNMKGRGDCFYTIPTDVCASNPGPQFPALPYENSPLAPLVCKLEGMGLFCGGGNLDRGLEDSGAVEFKHAIDWDAAALHTYRANLKSPEDTKCFLGSVDDYLLQALEGALSTARIGNVDILTAGSPCPAFSVLQPDKQSPRSLKNASLVASVLSYVDHYMPSYFLLENVDGIATTPKDLPQDQNVFSQLLCCLIGMGYQVQQFLMDAWSFSSCQSRTRVFVVATVPGICPLDRPPHTHAHYWAYDEFKNKSLGRGSNNIPFGQRYDDVTPFPFVSFSDATNDLPDIGDGHTWTSVRYPDHRLSRRLNWMERDVIKAIPRQPCRMGLARAAIDGKIAQRFKDRWLGNKNRARDISSSFQRICPYGPIPTITTSAHLLDAFHGRFVHYEQHRPMTIMEARRAQGFPDHEVIIGTPVDQWRIVGNSVDRNVSFVLGLSLRESWLAGKTEVRTLVNTTTTKDIRAPLSTIRRIVDTVIIERSPRVPERPARDTPLQERILSGISKRFKLSGDTQLSVQAPASTVDTAVASVLSSQRIRNDHCQGEAERKLQGSSQKPLDKETNDLPTPPSQAKYDGPPQHVVSETSDDLMEISATQFQDESGRRNQQLSSIAKTYEVLPQPETTPLVNRHPPRARSVVQISSHASEAQATQLEPRNVVVSTVGPAPSDPTPQHEGLTSSLQVVASGQTFDLALSASRGSSADPARSYLDIVKAPSPVPVSTLTREESPQSLATVTRLKKRHSSLLVQKWLSAIEDFGSEVTDPTRTTINLPDSSEAATQPSSVTYTQMTAPDLVRTDRSTHALGEDHFMIEGGRTAPRRANMIDATTQTDNTEPLPSPQMEDKTTKPRMNVKEAQEFWRSFASR